MEFESFRRTPPALNLSALIDVVFILVIFVVLAANFQRIRDIDVNLPAAKASGEAPAEALTLVIDSAGKLRLDGAAIAAEELGDRLSTSREAHESLLILADGAVAFERAVAVLGEASAAGFQKVSVATREPAR